MNASKALNAKNNPRNQARLVRFTAQELEDITERARVCGRPVARYIRECALGASLRSRRPAAGEALIRQLSRVATRLVSAAEAANHEHLACASELEAAVSDALDAIKQIE